MEWIPYSQISNLKKIAEGGYGIIYQANWRRKNETNETIAVNELKNSQNINKEFLNEVTYLKHREIIDNFSIKSFFFKQTLLVRFTS